MSTCSMALQKRPISEQDRQHVRSVVDSAAEGSSEARDSLLGAWEHALEGGAVICCALSER